MKYIIFDLDGTLIDSMPTWHGTGAAFLEKHGFAVPEDIHDVVKTLTLYQTAEYFRHDLGVPFDAQQIVDEITSYVTDAYKYTIPLRPSAKEYLEAMAKRCEDVHPHSIRSRVYPACVRPSGYPQIFRLHPDLHRAGGLQGGR